MHAQAVPSGGKQQKQGKTIVSSTKAAFKGPLFSINGKEIVSLCHDIARAPFMAPSLLFRENASAPWKRKNLADAVGTRHTGFAWLNTKLCFIDANKCLEVLETEQERKTLNSHLFLKISSPSQSNLDALLAIDSLNGKILLTQIAQELQALIAQH